MSVAEQGGTAIKIHKLIETQVARFEQDPIHGQQRVLRTVIAPARDERLVHEGKEYELDLEDGAFDVPHELGQLLIKRAGWHEGPNPFAEDLRAVLKPAKKKAEKADDRAEDPKPAKGEASKEDNAKPNGKGKEKTKSEAA